MMGSTTKPGLGKTLPGSASLPPGCPVTVGWERQWDGWGHRGVEQWDTRDAGALPGRALPRHSTPPLLPEPRQIDAVLVWTGAVGGPGALPAVVGRSWAQLGTSCTDMERYKLPCRGHAEGRAPTSDTKEGGPSMGPVGLSPWSPLAKLQTHCIDL